MFSKKDLELKLRQAAGQGNLIECKKLIELQGVDINAVGGELRRNALHWAALFNRVRVVRYLMSQGAKSEQDAEGDSPIDLTTLTELKRHFIYYHSDSAFKSKPYTKKELIN